MLCCGVASPVFAGRFPDVGDEYPYQSQIEALAAAHVVEGFQDGTFGPNQYISRQQFAKMIVLALALPVSDTSVCAFKDVEDTPGELYPYHYVAAAADNKITEGIDAATFAPLRNITIAQAITMVSRSAASLTEEPPAGVKSVFGTFDTVHTPWADRAQYAGLLDSLDWSAAKDQPTDPITRGEVAALLCNLVALRYASGSLQFLVVTDEHLSTWQAAPTYVALTDPAGGVAPEAPGPAAAATTAIQHYAARIENRGNAVVELYGSAVGMTALGDDVWQRDLLEFIPRVLAPGEAAFVGFETTSDALTPTAASVRLSLQGLPVGSSLPRLPMSQVSGRTDSRVGYVATGEVANNTDKDAVLIDLGVALYGADNKLLGFQAGYLHDLEAGDSASFVAAQHVISPTDAALVTRLVGVSGAADGSSDP